MSPVVRFKRPSLGRPRFVAREIRFSIRSVWLFSELRVYSREYKDAVRCEGRGNFRSYSVDLRRAMSIDHYPTSKRKSLGAEEPRALIRSYLWRWTTAAVFLRRSRRRMDGEKCKRRLSAPHEKLSQRFSIRASAS